MEKKSTGNDSVLSEGILETIKYNSFVTAMTAYTEAKARCAKADLDTLKDEFYIYNSSMSKEKLDEMNKNRSEDFRVLINGVLETLGYICLLYLNNQIPDNCVRAVEDAISTTMREKNYYEMVMEAYSKHKDLAIVRVWDIIRNK